ncbi:CDP-alcohol phosphatidyltransferase family protein [Stutzerimonas azotifigens]|uniref:CDP-alcohol phosphatidyltransferase family protein n=1 Tax=Stutzerimonas azotifigens TaxID=291995 RepID=UPI0003FFE163|nr:CDP-alcohol phosphatidyltransferase family protein [Stutzerimonas azotifigens]
MRHLPNLLTCLRLALVLPVAWLLLRQQYPQALWLFLLAGLSDALDGLLARRFGWTSRLGAWLDPIADKLLLVISYVCLTLNGLVPVWLTAVLLLRDLVIVGGAGAFRYRVGALDIRPTWLGKCSTVLQIVLVLALLLETSLLPGMGPANHVLLPLVALLTLSSGAHYVWQWTTLYRRHKACP